MKNEQYSIREELPKEIRLEVYQEAISILQNFLKTGNSDKYSANGALCLLLPCLLWDLVTMWDEDPQGNHWDPYHVPQGFPEIKPFVDMINQDDSAFYSKPVEEIYQLRIEFLEDVVKTLI